MSSSSLSVLRFPVLVLALASSVATTNADLPETLPPASDDLDGDGAPNDVDCDDADPGTYPGAPDAVGDGVDADCNGFDTPVDGVWTQSDELQFDGTVAAGSSFVQPLTFRLRNEVFTNGQPTEEAPWDPVSATAHLEVTLIRPPGATGAGDFDILVHNELIYGDFAGLSYGTHVLRVDDILQSDLYWGCVEGADGFCRTLQDFVVESNGAAAEIEVLLTFEASGVDLPQGVNPSVGVD